VAFQYLKGAYKHEGKRLFMRLESDRTRGNGSKLREGRFGLDIRRKFFTRRVVTHWTGCPRRCGCPIPGGIQGQAGCGSGQPGLLVGDPAHSRGLELDEHCGPFHTRPFHDSMIWFYDSESRHVLSDLPLITPTWACSATAYSCAALKISVRIAFGLAVQHVEIRSSNKS